MICASPRKRCCSSASRTPAPRRRSSPPPRCASPGLDEQVAYSKALDEAGIPYFISEFEEKMTSFDHLQIQLETFVENIQFA